MNELSNELINLSINLWPAYSTFVLPTDPHDLFFGRKNWVSILAQNGIASRRIVLVQIIL